MSDYVVASQKLTGVSAGMIEGWQNGAEDTQQAYDLLVKAAVTQDEAEKARLLKELESKESYLSEEAKAALRQLKAPKEPVNTPNS